MPYIKGENRNQLTLLTSSLDEYIAPDSYIRIIDAFVEKLDLKNMNFVRHTASKNGRPGYDPKDMLKLYIYGYLNKIRSSRKLQTECSRNIELMWLLGKLVPDFRCIADFRKENAKAIKLVFREFTKLCDKLGLIGKELIAVDGSKFKAVNSKDNNFTRDKLSDRIKWIDEKLSYYLHELDENDKNETPLSEKGIDEIKSEIAELENRKEKYLSYLNEMLQNNSNQKSLTDSESKLMKNNGKMDVCFNVQTVVDSKYHIVSDFLVTDHCNDMGLLEDISQKVKKTLDISSAALVADKGYRSVKDVKNCILNGDIPNVPYLDTKDDYSFELPFCDTEITPDMKASSERSDIEKCLSAGIVPDVLAGQINVEIKSDNKETVKIINIPETTKVVPCQSDGIFVRNTEENIVVCPMGEILRKKSVNKGKIRYANIAACKQCNNPCTTAAYKTVDFKTNQTIVKSKTENRNKFKEITVKAQKIIEKSTLTTRKVIVLFLPDKKILKQRKCIVEHPFGTVKRWNDGAYLLMRGKVKAGADLALSFLGYNLKRAINILGVKKILAKL